MGGDISTIRLWTSLTSIYRVLAFPAQPSVSSITDPGIDWLKRITQSPVDLQCLREAISLFWHRSGTIESLRKKWLDSGFDFFPIGKSSPVTSLTPLVNPELFRIGKETGKGKETRGMISTFSGVIQASAHFLTFSHPEIVDSMMVFASNTRGFFEFFSALQRSGMSQILWRLDTRRRSMVFLGQEFFLDNGEHYIGSLGLKDEPAGKIRVFAMVDCWTQWLMNPLHKLLQDVLRVHDSDATFDQVGAMDRKIEEIRRRYRKPKAFSYDLSSATDRLPVGLQTMILSPLLGEFEAKA